MRMQLWIAAALAAGGCGGSTGCPAPKPFTLEEELVESTVEALLADNSESDPATLECDVVCESRYLDRHPEDTVASTHACKLIVDGELTGEAAAIVGTLYCEGRAHRGRCDPH